MAQIGVQYPGLEGMFKDAPIFGSQLALQQFNSAQDNNSINQAQGIQDLFQQEDMHPLKMQQLGLSNQTAEAQLPGIVANSGLLEDKAKNSRGNVDWQGKADRAKLIAGISDDEVKHMEALAQMLAMSPDPEMRARGEEMLNMHKDVVKEKAKQKYMSERQLELERLRGENSANVAGIRANAMKDAAGLRAGASGGKPPTMSQFEASLRQQLLQDPTNEDVAQALADLLAGQQARAAASANVTDNRVRELLNKPGQATTTTQYPVRKPESAPVEPRTDGYTGPGSSPQNPISAEMIKKAFGDFDPQKYDYRVSPEGKVQRKLRNQ